MASKSSAQTATPPNPAEEVAPTRTLRVVAIDPGSVHCGVAVFLGERCYEAYEVDPPELYRRLESWLKMGTMDVLVVEEFRLYEDKAKVQIGSTMATCEVIGVIKYLVGRWGVEGGVELALQGAGIKEGCQKILRAKGVVSLARSRRAGGHAFDAELHGQYYIRRRIEREGAQR